MTSVTASAGIAEFRPVTQSTRRRWVAPVAALPSAKRRTLEGQDHGAAPEVLAPLLKEFFR
jgi:hypothetical protein